MISAAISLLNVTKRREMRANPQFLRSLVEGADGVRDIVIDEIQTIRSRNEKTH